MPNYTTNFFEVVRKQEIQLGDNKENAHNGPQVTDNSGVGHAAAQPRVRPPQVQPRAAGGRNILEQHIPTADRKTQVEISEKVNLVCF